MQHGQRKFGKCEMKIITLISTFKLGAHLHWASHPWSTLEEGNEQQDRPSPAQTNVFIPA